MPEPAGIIAPLTGTSPVPVDARAPHLPAKRFGKLLDGISQRKLVTVNLGILVLLTLFCFVGPDIYRTNQISTNLLLANLPPSAAHPLGTTPEGRDELGALMLGGQSTLEVGFSVALLSTGFGMLWGAVAGYIGGLIDSAMMRIVDAVLAIPFLFFVVLLASITTPNLLIIVLSITAVSWLSTARLARGEVLSLRTREYIEASRGFGGKHRHVVVRHLVPNVVGVVAVNGTLKMADAILTYVAVAFLGLSVPPPATSWGDLLTTGIDNLFDGYWWQLWPPAVAIVILVLVVNILGDGLHDQVEKRLKDR
jgi:oligopeptide transport system permease protein